MLLLRYKLLYFKREHQSMKRVLSSILPAAMLCLASSGAIAASAPGDVVGKITVGYQGWFACTGDNAPINQWWHYSSNGQQPNNNNSVIHCWPDTREFQNTYATG